MCGMERIGTKSRRVEMKIGEVRWLDEPGKIYDDFDSWKLGKRKKG